MHRHKILAQFSLILSILNLGLAAPTIVQEIHGARGDEMRELKVASDRSTSPRSSQDGQEVQEVQEVQDAMASPPHSVDGSASSGYSPPHSPSDPSDFGYSWFLERPPHPSLHDSDSTPLHPNSGSMEITPEEPLRSVHPPEEIPASPPALLQELTPLPHSPQTHPSSSASSEITPEEPLGSAHPPEEIPGSPPALLQELTPLPHGPDPSTPAPSEITPVNRFLRANPGDIPISIEMLQGWMRNPQWQRPPTPHNAEFFNENMVKKLKIVAGVVVAGGVIAGIAGSQIKHKHRDSRDS